MIPRALTDLSREELLVYLTEVAPPYRVRPVDLIRTRRVVISRRWQVASAKASRLGMQVVETSTALVGLWGRDRERALGIYSACRVDADRADKVAEQLWRQLETLSRAFDEALRAERSAR